MLSTKTSFDARLKASRSRWRAKALAEARLRVLSVLLFSFMLMPRLAAAQVPPAAVNACVACHARQEDQRVATPAALFSGSDVHRENGFKCTDCHGGNAAATDKARAHDPAQQFKGRPAGQAI